MHRGLSTPKHAKASHARRNSNHACNRRQRHVQMRTVPLRVPYGRGCATPPVSPPRSKWQPHRLCISTTTSRLRVLRPKVNVVKRLSLGEVRNLQCIDGRHRRWRLRLALVPRLHHWPEQPALDLHLQGARRSGVAAPRAELACASKVSKPPRHGRPARRCCRDSTWCLCAPSQHAYMCGLAAAGDRATRQAAPQTVARHACDAGRAPLWPR